MRQTLKESIERIYGLTLDNIDISRNDEARFGAYTTNVAFIVAAETGKSPQDIAEALAAAFSESEHQLIARAQRGHLNFRLPEEVHLGHYCPDDDRNVEGTGYFNYRLRFIQERLASGCRRLDRIQFFDERLRIFYIDWVLHGRSEPAEQAFLAFDVETNYQELDNYQRNVLYTLVSLAVDRLPSNA